MSKRQKYGIVLFGKGWGSWANKLEDKGVLRLHITKKGTIPLTYIYEADYLAEMTETGTVTLHKNYRGLCVNDFLHMLYKRVPRTIPVETESAEGNEKHAMIREGICPADVATSMPGYDGPEVTCETCPDNDGCEYKSGPTLADLAEGSEESPDRFVMVHQSPGGAGLKYEPEVVIRTGSPEPCEHKNTLDPSPEEPWKVVWCRDCGALSTNGGKDYIIPGTE